MPVSCKLMSEPFWCYFDEWTDMIRNKLIVNMYNCMFDYIWSNACQKPVDESIVTDQLSFVFREEVTWLFGSNYDREILFLERVELTFKWSGSLYQ